MMRLPFAALALASLTLASSAFADDKKPAKPSAAAPAKDGAKDAAGAPAEAKHPKAHAKKHGPTAKLDHKHNVVKKDELAKIEAKAHKKGELHGKADAKTDANPDAKGDGKSHAKADGKKLEPKADAKADKQVDGDEPPEELTGALPQKKLADKKKLDKKPDDKKPDDKKSDDKKSDDKKPEKKELPLPHGGKATKVSATSESGVEFQKLQKKIAADKKGKMKACLHPAVTFARLGQATDVSFPLTTCKGGAAPGAVDNLSILARPYDVAMPSALAPSKALAMPKKAGKASADVAPGIRRIDAGMVSRLQAIADHFPGKTITLVSGYRPGSKGSPHQAARAMDVRLDGVTNEALVAYCRTLKDTGCGYYPNSYFVHVDVRAEGTGHVFWIDASGPGEKPQYVKQWPPPAKVEPTDMVKGDVEQSAKDAQDAKDPQDFKPAKPEVATPATVDEQDFKPAKPEVATPATVDEKEIGALEDAEDEAAVESPSP